MSDKYIVRYYSRSSGKAVEQINRLMCEYIPQHIGKTIKFEVVSCEEINKLKNALEIANKFIKLSFHIRSEYEAEIVEECAREAQRQIHEIMESK